ncbi:MAG: ribonuclease P protein component [Clostridia bacterium]|nr:ribonuclease P protein component [Clostridia bacterium]
MLKKDNRLKKRYQFNYVYKSGEHFSGKALVLYLTPSRTKSIKV